MNRLRAFLRRFARDQRGSAVIEFAALGPALILMVLGVLQIGFYMQAQNSLRAVTGDLNRSVMVEYQNNNNLSHDQIRSRVFSTASAPPYLLRSDRLDVSVADATVQRVTGAREITLDLSYDVPNVLGFRGIDVLTLDYERPIFVPVLAAPTV